jgi:DNA-binding NtrC family response regulator
MQKLVLYDWPGNVRELENVIQRALVLSTQTIIRDADIVLPTSESTGYQESFREAKSRVIAQFEKHYIQELLLAHEGNITQTAQAAQKNRRAFWQLIQKHHIDVQKFKPAH